MATATSPASDEVLVDTTVTADEIKPTLENLAPFMVRYVEHLYDRRQVPHAETYVRGLLSDVERKTIEPIADQAGQNPRPLQRFVGEGRFDDALLVRELQLHVAEEIGDPGGILVGDPSCFEKKGNDSVGVQRQWNGRVGKVDNCQKGIFLGYVSPEGAALIDRRLYLPAEGWSDNAEARKTCHVPQDVEFRTTPELTLTMIDRVTVPYQWFTGDEEYGRPPSFRAGLRDRQKLYAIEIPSNTHVRPVRHDRKSRAIVGAETRVSDLLRSLKPGNWNRVLVKDGTKEPIYVQAAEFQVLTKAEGARTFDVEERLVLIRTLAPKIEIKYVITNAKKQSISIGAIVRAILARHVVEELFQRAKGEAGLADYEVRSWIGWHHHITLALLAAWYLELERRRFRENATRNDGAAGSPCDRDAA